MSDLKSKLLEIQSKLLREAKSATGISLKSVLDKVIKLISYPLDNLFYSKR
jgi:hypothetical protein